MLRSNTKVFQGMPKIGLASAPESLRAETGYGRLSVYRICAAVKCYFQLSSSFTMATSYVS